MFQKRKLVLCFTKGTKKGYKTKKAESKFKSKELQLSYKVVFMFVLPKLVNIDIFVKKSKNHKNLNHLGL